MTVVIEGRLEYLTWRRPWSVMCRDKEFDLAPLFWKVATKVRNELVSMPVKPDSFGLKADATSDFECQFDEVGGGIIASKRTGFGFTNVLSYAETIMCNLNGREVIASIEDDSFVIFANPHAKPVPVVVRKLGAGNSVPISDDVIRTRCGVGVGPTECCIFVSAGANGFNCEKFAASTTRMILSRKAEGTMKAQRIGDCRIEMEPRGEGE